MSCLGIVAAFSGELGPLIRGWRRTVLSGGGGEQVGWRGRIGSIDCIALAGGMGAEAAARACVLACSMAASDGGLRGLVSLGWAGALSGDLAAGQAYRLAEVVDARNGDRFPTSFLSRPEIELKLVSIDHVAQVHEKHHLEQRYGAAMVDMEAVAVARAAHAASLPFYCFKAVSDVRDEVVPDFSRWISPHGKLDLPSLIVHLMLRPKYWSAMARMGKNSRIGARALAHAVQQAF